jgi:hypothetical protein
MSDWQVGDLAVCVDATSRIARTGTSLAEGQVYRVSGLHMPGKLVRSDFGSPADLGLFLVGLRSVSTSGAFDARRFRKVTPDKHEACEDEFVTLLKRGKVSA